MEYFAEDDLWFDVAINHNAAIKAIWASVDATMPDLSHLKGWWADRDQQAHMGVEFD